MLASEVAKRRARRRRFGRRSVFLGGEAPTLTFGSGTPLGVKAWIALGADLTQSWLTWNWFDITPYIRWTPGVSTSQGRREQDDTVAPSWARATIGNPDGIFARLNPMSPLFGLLTRFTPIRFAVDPGTGYTHRYFGFVNDWPKRWRDKSANDPVVEIVCRGPMHRLLRSQRLRSPLYRTLTGVAGSAAFLPDHAYWPMEDGASTQWFASGLAGKPVMTFTGGVTPAGSTHPPGSDGLPVFDADGRATGTIPAYTDTSSYWQAQVLVYLPQSLAASGSLTLLTVKLEGPTTGYIALSVNPSTSEMTFAQYSQSNAVLVSSTTTYDTSAGTTINNWFWAVLTCSKDEFGALDHVQAALTQIADPNGGSNYTFGTLGDTIGNTGFSNATAIGLNGALCPAPSGAEGAIYGHPLLLTNDAYPGNGGGGSPLAYVASAIGHKGELAHERIIRLCAEEDVPLACESLTSAACGPQPSGNLITVLRDAAKADLGLLYEHEYGLAYKSLAERYNTPTSLTLDVALAQITEDLEPADSDLHFRNRWTARRTDGSSYTAEPEGGLSETDLAYDAADTFNVETDDQLPDVAGYLVRRDTADEDYWPSLGINLAKNPELIAGWTAMPFNGRVSVLNVMEEAGVSTIDAVREGWTEHWNSLQWSAKMNTSPASVLDVGVYGSDPEDVRYDSADSTLTADYDADDVSLVVATTSGHAAWITTASYADQFPFDVYCEGIRLTVTAITSATSPQTFTVTRSVDGFDKPLPSGAQVRLWTPARYAL